MLIVDAITTLFHPLVRLVVFPFYLLFCEKLPFGEGQRWISHREQITTVRLKLIEKEWNHVWIWNLFEQMDWKYEKIITPWSLSMIALIPQTVRRFKYSWYGYIIKPRDTYALQSIANKI